MYTQAISHNIHQSTIRILYQCCKLKRREKLFVLERRNEKVKRHLVIAFILKITKKRINSNC